MPYGTPTGQAFGSQIGYVARPGFVGELIELQVLSIFAVPLVNGGFVEFITMPLPEGDWDVSASVSFNADPTTNLTRVVGYITQVPGTLDDESRYVQDSFAAAGVVPVGDIVRHISPSQVSLLATANVYLGGFATFSVAGLVVFGTLRARRMS